MMMAVMLSAPKPSVLCKLAGQLMSIIISTMVARPENLLLLIEFSSLASVLFLVLLLRGGLLPRRAFYPVLTGLDAAGDF
jgi:hypothetical protein